MVFIKCHYSSLKKIKKEKIIGAYSDIPRIFGYKKKLKKKTENGPIAAFHKHNRSWFYKNL